MPFARINKIVKRWQKQYTQYSNTHFSSSTDKSKHEDCPVGSNSWCSLQRGIAKQTNTQVQIKNPLSDAVATENQHIFDRLDSETFLTAGEQSKTKSINKLSHNVFWSLIPEEKCTPLLETQIRVGLVTLHVDAEYCEAF